MKINRKTLLVGAGLTVFAATAAIAARQAAPYYEKVAGIWTSQTVIGDAVGYIDIPTINTRNSTVGWNADFPNNNKFDNYIGGTTWGYDQPFPKTLSYTVKARNWTTRNQGSLFFGSYGWSCGAGSNGTEDVEFYIANTFFDDNRVPYGTVRAKNSNGGNLSALSGTEVYDIYVSPQKKQIGGPGEGTACTPVDGQGRAFWQVWAVRRNNLELSVDATRTIKFEQIFNVMRTVKPMKTTLKYYGVFVEAGEGTKGTIRFTDSRTLR